MARLDVCPTPGGGPGYVLDVQALLLAGLATRIVIPLSPEGHISETIEGLNPVVEIGGERHVLFTQALAAVPMRELKQPVASLADHHNAVTRALDLLFVGF